MDFTDPFTGMVPPRKLNREEVLRALRIDAAAELDAINLYQAHIDAIDDEQIREVIAHIRDEEKEHVAEFMAAIQQLDPTQAQLFASEHATTIGSVQAAAWPSDGEVQEALPGTQASSTTSKAPTGFTVGSLLGEEQT